jgi:hypothetical protein
MTLPKESSTVTLNDVVKAKPAVAVACGSDEKTTWDAAAGFTVTAELSSIRLLSGDVVSVAVSTQLVPTLIVTALNVAIPPLADCVSVPPSVQPAVSVEIVIESEAPLPDVITASLPSSTLTVNAERLVPAVTLDGTLVKTSPPAGTTTAAPGLTPVKSWEVATRKPDAA